MNSFFYERLTTTQNTSVPHNISASRTVDKRVKKIVLHSRFNRYNPVSAAGTYNLVRQVQSWWMTQFPPQTVLCKRHSNVKGERLIYPNVSNAEAKPNLMSDARWVQWATRPPLCRSAFPPPRPPWSAGIRLIILCQLKKWSKNAGTSRSAVVTGWGRTSERSRPASVLREVSVSFAFSLICIGHDLESLFQVPILSNKQCERMYRYFLAFSPFLYFLVVRASGQKEYIPYSQFLCAGQTGRDSCDGDSGGPLVVRVSPLLKIPHNLWHKILLSELTKIPQMIILSAPRTEMVATAWPAWSVGE